MGSLPEQCCTLPPFKSDYQPVGEKFKIKVDGQSDLEIYTTGPSDAKTVLVGIYGMIHIFIPQGRATDEVEDIFGLHSNTLQGADVLARSSSYRIVIPDFFRGVSWPVDNIPAKEGRPFLNNWIQDIGSWEKIRPSLLAVVEALKAEGVTSIGVRALFPAS
jgi:hypothetical protein